MIWQVKGQHPVGSPPMPIVDVYSMSEKLDTQSNHYTCHTCTDLVAQGWHSDPGRVCKPDISSGWICV
jgi:hypothetical protein